MLSNSERFKSAKILRFVNAMVTYRFMVTLEKNPEMQELLAHKRLAIGCMDTWLLHRLTNGRIFITEPSAISSTGLYDPFVLDYGKLLLRIIGFPTDVLFPTVVDTTSLNVTIDPEFLEGRTLKIFASIGDAQSAAFGAGCHLDGSVSICLGTGTFFDAVVGDHPRCGSSPNSGFFPLVGWCIDGKAKFVVEGHMNCSATVINWANRVGILDDIERASEIAWSAEPIEKLHFIPGFDGIQTPMNNEYTCGGLLGLHSGVTKAQIVRALLQSIAFCVAQMYELCEKELLEFKVRIVRVSGGVSNNDFICQQIANLINMPIERVSDNQLCASRGAAFLAAIGSGRLNVFEVNQFITIEKIFVPDNEERHATVCAFEEWKDSQKRCLHFYK